MYCPKSFPATAFYLDYELNVFEIEMNSRIHAKRKGGAKTFYPCASRMFTSRKRALSAAESELRKTERLIDGLKKHLETKRARVAKQLAA